MAKRLSRPVEAGFPLEGPYQYDREADLTKRVASVLRDAGWEVVVFAAHKSVPSQMAGWVDVFAARRDEVLLIECKSMTGMIEESQREFEWRMHEHVGPHLHHVVLFDLRQLEARWVIELA